MDFSGMMAVTWISAFHGLNLQVANWDGYGALCQCLFMKGLRSWGPQTAATQIQENSAVEYQYLTCLNWAFAQLGVGSSPALATNVPEMAYCNLVGHGCSPSKWRKWIIKRVTNHLLYGMILQMGVNLFRVFFFLDSRG